MAYLRLSCAHLNRHGGSTVLGRTVLTLFCQRISSTGAVLSFTRERTFSVAACKHGDVAPDHTTVATAVQHSATDVVETSSQAKWAADASTVMTELPAQGDFSSLGLGGYSPTGLIQWSLEYIHVHTHLPWWVAIAATTVALRLALFPVAVRVQANAARLNNIQPETVKLMAKIKEHDQAGNTMLAAQQKAKLFALYQKHECNPLKMMIMPLLQVPIFLSFFIAIRRMAAVPVESMKTGGVLWFTDLTAPDPYYVLPVMACLSFLITMELGGEAGVSNPQVEKMKTFFRGMAIVLIPVTSTFPTGLFMYWLTSSGLLMGQILLLKVPRLRTALGIPLMVKHPTDSKESQQRKGVFATIKENYRSTQLIDQAKKREAEAVKAYKKLQKDPYPKLYDQPPHRRSRSS